MSLALSAALLLGTFWDDGGESGEFLIRALAISYTAHALWAFWSWRVLTRRWMDAYSLFLLSLALFSGGNLVLVALGLLGEGRLTSAFRPATAERTVLLVTASLVAFHLGAVLGCARRPGEGGAGRAVGRVVPDAIRLRRIGYLFVVAALPAAAIQAYQSIRIIATSGYLGLYQQQVRTGLGNWISVMASFSVPGLIILLATRPERRTNVRLCWLLALGSIGVNLFYGARAAAVMALLPILVVHHLLVHRIRPVLALALSLGTLVATPLIGTLRDMNLAERIATVETGTVSSGWDATAAVREMGGSMDTVAYTIDLVPERRSFEAGMGYLRALTTVFPNVFWDVHPALGAGAYAQWLIREVDPFVYEAGGGLGFSMIAEAYVNASWWGTPVVMLLAGFLLSAFVAWTRRGADPVQYALEALVLSAILVLPRAESLAVVRSIVWTAVLPYLFLRLAPRPRRTTEPYLSKPAR